MDDLVILDEVINEALNRQEGSLPVFDANRTVVGKVPPGALHVEDGVVHCEEGAVTLQDMQCDLWNLGIGFNVTEEEHGEARKVEALEAFLS